MTTEILAVKPVMKNQWEVILIEWWINFLSYLFLIWWNAFDIYVVSDIDRNLEKKCCGFDDRITGEFFLSSNVYI